MLEIDKWELIKVKFNIKGKLLDIKNLNLAHAEIKNIKKVKDGIYSVSFLISSNRYSRFNEEIN